MLQIARFDIETHASADPLVSGRALCLKCREGQGVSGACVGLALSTRPVTLDGARLTLGTRRATLGGARLTLGTRRATLGGARLTIGTRRATLGGTRLTLG